MFSSPFIRVKYWLHGPDQGTVDNKYEIDGTRTDTDPTHHKSDKHVMSLLFAARIPQNDVDAATVRSK